MKRPQPNAEQLAALREYARQHGRHWKHQLKTDWMLERDERMPVLRQMRNGLGMCWLTKFRFPKEAK